MTTNPRNSTEASPGTTRTDPLRTDAQEKVTGQAQFVEDIPVEPNIAYGAPIQSPLPHARIVSIDSTIARSVPGVLAVLDRETLGEYGVNADSSSVERDFITVDKARFIGDLLGMVVAEDLRTARRAAKLVEVDYEPLPSIFSAAEALTKQAPLLHEELGSNSAFDYSLEWGSVTDGVKEADYVVEDTFISPSLFHHPMENIGSCLVSWEDGVAQVWAPTNTPMRDALDTANLFGIDAEQVRLRVPYTGGAFGSKKVTPEINAALAISRKIGRPVKLSATSEESFRVATRHAMEYKATLGVKRDGSLVSLDVELLVDTGAYGSSEAKVATRNATMTSWGCYDIPHFRARATTAYTNKTPAATHRGTGRTQPTFGLECLLDKAARVLDMDPIEFRNINMLVPGKSVPAQFKLNGKLTPSDTPTLRTDYRGLLRQAVDTLDEGDSNVPKAESRPTSTARGRGVALSLRHLGLSELEATCVATLDADGRVRISHNAPDAGQGIFTMISAVVEQTLGIPRSQVLVEKPDTGNNLAFPGTSAQRTTVQMGTAVQSACEQLQAAMVEVARRARGGEASEWSLAGGQLTRGNESLPLMAVAELSTDGPLTAFGTDKAVREEGFGDHDHWAGGMAAAEVEVDTDTGEVVVVQYSIVADTGKVLHYDSAMSQVV
ncbi:MAG: xanthine dehydrogenase family protein molybdopterin-binding subunit, partial [Dehalococcoidia bacterium]